MRDYAKVAPQFWTGRTGKSLKAAGPEAVIVAMYLMTSPHANMIGLYHCPVAYIAVDTGLTIEGAKKGLQSSIEAEFCQYDEALEYVFVVEFAKYQIGVELDPKDKRCQGVVNELAKVPKCLLHNSFRAHYAVPYHLPLPKPLASPLQAPTKPGAGAGAGAVHIEAKASHPDESGSLRRFPPGFADFWAAYPRKVGKDAAAKAFAKRRVGVGLLAQMLVAIAEQKSGEQWLREGGQFIPHPATWLNEGRWQDESSAAGVAPELAELFARGRG